MQNRPGIGELIEEALGGAFTRIVTEDLSRISRDQGDVAHFYKKMMFLDIQLETVTEGVIGELHIGLKGTMNAVFLKDLSDKSRRGLVAAVLNGSIPGGRTYGYDVVREVDSRGHLIRGLRKIIPAEAEIVRRIFREYQEGKTLQAICDGLNADQIPCPNGGVAWQTVVLAGMRARQAGILRQTLYKGLVTFGRSHAIKHPDTGKRTWVARPEREWLKVPAPELAILSEDEFDRVQDLLEQRSHHAKQQRMLHYVLSKDEKADRHREETRRWRAQKLKGGQTRKQQVYLVSGRLWCGRHDTALASITAGTYGCPDISCPNRNQRLDNLLFLTIGALQRFGTADIEEYYRATAPRISELKAEAEQRQRKLDETRQEIRQLLKSIGQNEGGKETILYIEDLDKFCARERYELERIGKELTALERKDDAVIHSALLAFHIYVEALALNPKDQIATRKLHPCISRITIIPGWNDADQSMHYRAAIRYNIPKLFETFAHPDHRADVRQSIARANTADLRQDETHSSAMENTPPNRYSPASSSDSDETAMAFTQEDLERFAPNDELIPKLNEAEERGDEEAADAIRRQMIYPAEVLLAIKETAGAEWLLEQGWRLDEAERKYGKDWLYRDIPD